MARIIDRTTDLGPITLRSPFVGASGTVGSVVDFLGVASPQPYGALVAKSVSPEPWDGNRPPRLAPAGAGMLNSIGIQNPGIDAWVRKFGPLLGEIGVPVWGSAVGHSPEGFSRVAQGLEDAGVQAVEVNLSCPNLDGHGLIALDPDASARVINSVRKSVSVPVSAKLSPNASDIVAVARSVRNAGADWVALTNTVWGASIDIETRRPRLSTTSGGYSGPPLKPIALRCVTEVASALPGFPIVGCGGVTKGADAIEFLMAGASAVAIGTIHFAEPRAVTRIDRELVRWCRRHGVNRVSDLIAAAVSSRS